MPCRIKKHQEWATRLMLEFLYFKRQAIFITLTYDNEHLPEKEQFPNGNLVKQDVQKFLKRVRKQLGDGKRISYFACGEYGDRTERAHYHIIIYGYPPHQIDPIIKKCWSFGFVSTSDLQQHSVARMRYITGYTLKKMTQKECFEDGREPEFSLQSRKPALGIGLLDSFIPYLIKHNLYPISGITQYQKFYMEENFPDMKPWNGTFHLEGKHWLLDQFAQTQLFKKMYNNVLKEYENNEGSKLVFNRVFKTRSNVLHDDNYFRTMKFIRSEEHEQETIKSEKLQRRQSEKKQINTV